MLRSPTNAHFEKEMINKKVFLKGVLNRLKNDVGSYLDFVTQRNVRSGEGVGFWGSARLLMPVIEAIANAYQTTPVSILRNYLHIKFPNLVWVLYRHSLAHNDLLQHGHYNGIDASWGVSMFGSNHIMQKGVLGLDTLTLYNDLVKFLENEISSCGEDEEVEIIKGVTWDNPNDAIKDEFNELNSRP